MSSQPSVQTDLHWTASDGYSTSNSNGKQSAVVLMEEDQQSDTPAPQEQHQVPPRGLGIPHSNSAPDLRLMLATELPDNRPMYLPVPGSYVGALVPYKGPEVQPSSPCISFMLPSTIPANAPLSGRGWSVSLLLQGDMLY